MRASARPVLHSGLDAGCQQSLVQLASFRLVDAVSSSQIERRQVTSRTTETVFGFGPVRSVRSSREPCLKQSLHLWCTLRFSPRSSLTITLQGSHGSPRTRRPCSYTKSRNRMVTPCTGQNQRKGEIFLAGMLWESVAERTPGSVDSTTTFWLNYWG